ncbi:MAG: cytochrome c3 family protein [Acidobacteriota bacterium]
MRNGSRSKNILKAVFLFVAVTALAASCIRQEQRTSMPLTASETPEPLPARESNKTFEAFSHKIPEHQQFACDSCHRREGSSLEMKYAGHDSCIGCHLNQFTDKDQVICAICHKDTKATPPSMNTFPVKFIEGFNMKFDHAAHETGKGRPADGCAHCHNPSGPGQSIPIGITAHNDCYSCHTAESKIGSCTVCHQIGPYNRTTQSEYNFKAIFRHGDHTARQGVSCNECHNVIAGASNARQVTDITILEHRTTPGNNCLSCHNGRRAFTGNNPLDVNSCTRCHKGMGSSKLPPGTFTE